ncbi:MAG TPA: hypothetical protein VMX37_04480 [Acidimicrobiia bacterium]|nr:hypothetical protein [Acidimicrobiia bacterium]
MARSESRTTWLAIALAVAISVPYAVIFAQTIRAVVDPNSVPQEMLRELASLGLLTQGDEAAFAFFYLAIVVGAVSLVVLAVIVGLIARRQAAREAAFAVFGTIAVVAGLAGIGGLVKGRSPGGSWLAASTALACSAVVILLALQSTATAFELAEMRRHRRGGPH